jgi:tRNA wybutosine-synthesizing protein 3
MLRDRFLQRKTAVLLKLDKSSIGKWDKKIKSLCENINALENFYTTSSCSGRVLLMIEQEKKQNDLFLKVWHDKISFNILKQTLKDLLKANKIIKFKLEPPIIHIACRDLKNASFMLEKAKQVGFKRSSILTCEKNIFLELNSTEKLEFPIIKKEKMLVDDKFLKLIIEMSNKKLEKGWLKIKKLEKIV